MNATETKTRKGSKWQMCEKHAPWFAGESRYRIAECFVEGGPGGDHYAGGCERGTCRLWPGTDYYAAEYCTGELALDWTARA
jgi:hypothetical protein